MSAHNRGSCLLLRRSHSSFTAVRPARKGWRRAVDTNLIWSFFSNWFWNIPQILNAWTAERCMVIKVLEVVVSWAMARHLSRIWLYNFKFPDAKMLLPLMLHDVSWIVLEEMCFLCSESRGRALRVLRHERLKQDWERQHPRHGCSCQGRPCRLLLWETLIMTTGGLSSHLHGIHKGTAFEDAWSIGVFERGT